MSQVRTLLQEPIGVSPSGKATDSDSVIRRFESCYPCQVDPLAQSVEHLTFNQGVPRSSRGWITISGLFVKRLRHRPFTAGSGVRIPHRSPMWAISSAGRASALQAECQQFDPVIAHHNEKFHVLRAVGFFIAISLFPHLSFPLPLKNLLHLTPQRGIIRKHMGH